MTTVYYAGDASSTYYAKPLPLVESPWATDAVVAVEYGTIGEYTLDIDQSIEYRVYKQAGGSPAIGDAPHEATFPIDLTAAIQAKTDLIGTGSATVAAPVTVNGELNPIIQGQDYTGANAFVWTVDEYTDFVVGSTTVLFSGVTAACTDPVQGWEVSGTVTDNLDGTWEVTAELTQAITDALDETLNYDWSVQLTYNSLDRVPVKSNIKRPVSVLKKQNT